MRLGGRKAVLETPVIELLQYMIWDREEQKAKAVHTETQNYIHFLSMYHAHPMSDPKERKQYMEMLTPKQIDSNKATVLQSNQTDINYLKKLKAVQDAKMGGGNNGDNKGTTSPDNSNS